MKVGSIVKLGKKCLFNEAGTIGVCYEVYQLESVGYSLIFANGEYDGFSEKCLDLFGVSEIEFCNEVSGYSFENVMKLSSDFRSGYFDSVFRVNWGLIS